MADPSAAIAPVYDRFCGGIFRCGESAFLCVGDLSGAIGLCICGADRRNAAVVVERSGRTGQDRRKQDRLRSDVCGNDFFAVFVADFQDCSGAGTRSVSVLWICPCSVGDRSGHEFFYTTDALRAVYTVRRGDRSSSAGGVDSRNDRLRGDFCVSGQAGKPPA